MSEVTLYELGTTPQAVRRNNPLIQLGHARPNVRTSEHDVSL